MDWALVLGRHHRHTRMQTNFALTVRQRQVLLVVESDHDVASFRADLGENLEVGGWIVDGLLAGSRCQFFVPFGSHLLELAYIVFQELAKPLFSHSLLVCVNVCVCGCVCVCVSCVFDLQTTTTHEARRTTHDARGTRHIPTMPQSIYEQKRPPLTTHYPTTATHNTNQTLHNSLLWCFR